MTDGKLIARWTSALSRARVFEHPDSLEIESNEQYEVTKRRVFLDDVQLVTLHRRRGAAFLVVMGILSLFANFFILLGIFIGDEAAPVMGLMFGIIAVPSTIAFLVRLIWGLDIVTVFGRRSKLTMRFRLRKEKAREMYAHVCALVAEAQRRKAEEYATEAAVATAPESTEPPLPPGPPPL